MFKEAFIKKIVVEKGEEPGTWTGRMDFQVGEAADVMKHAWHKESNTVGGEGAWRRVAGNEVRKERQSNP